MWSREGFLFWHWKFPNQGYTSYEVLTIRQLPKDQFREKNYTAK